MKDVDALLAACVVILVYGTCVLTQWHLAAAQA
jgi:hypothetical protein